MANRISQLLTIDNFAYQAYIKTTKTTLERRVQNIWFYTQKKVFCLDIKNYIRHLVPVAHFKKL